MTVRIIDSPNPEPHSWSVIRQLGVPSRERFQMFVYPENIAHADENKNHRRKKKVVNPSESVRRIMIIMQFVSICKIIHPLRISI